jgi:hypothetical protein
MYGAAHGTEPTVFAKTKRSNPAAERLYKEHLGHPRKHGVLAGSLDRRFMYHKKSDGRIQWM